MDAQRPNCPDSRKYADRAVSFDDFPTQCPEVAQAVEAARRLAPSPRPAHLRGETGCGKNFLAQAIHHASGLQGPFVEVTIGGLPETLLHSALFGHVKGAFTSATEGRIGAFQEADGGTLFLDEIGDLPLASQPVLLRATSQRIFVPLGGKPFRATVRIVTATHRDLEQMVHEGTFRADLYHRICGHIVTLPPLRARREDLHSLLFGYLLAAERADLALEQAFEAEAWAAVDAYSWPGNLRELRNMAEQIALDVRARKVQAADLRLSGVAPAPAESLFVADRVTEAVRRHVREVVKRCGGKVAHAAARLGRSLAWVYSHIGSPKG